MTLSALVIPLLLALSVLLLWQLGRLYQACRRANRVRWGVTWMDLMDGLNRLFCYRYHRLNVLGLRLPAHGPAIVVSNHVSGLDPLLLMASARRPLRFIIAREQYERFGLNWLFRAVGCIPVDRDKRPERALREALRCLRRGEVVALFPHGQIHLDWEPSRKLKGGAMRLARLTGAPILPHRISGIRGEGHVIRGVLRRSHARIRTHPALYAEAFEPASLERRLQQVLEGREHI